MVASNPSFLQILLCTLSLTEFMSICNNELMAQKMWNYSTSVVMIEVCHDSSDVRDYVLEALQKSLQINT